MRGLIVVGVTAILPVVVAAAGPPGPGRCAVVSGSGLCLVEAADPARSGGPAARRGPGRKTTTHPAPPAPEPAVPWVTTPIIGGGWRIGPPPQLPPIGNAPVAAPAPAVLARRAVELLRLTRPSVRASVADRAFVGVPVWLWIDGGPANVGPVSATATVGAARVTATARLTRTVWAMGPPGAVVSCAGPGTAWTGQRGPSPDCGYVYAARSLPERTHGAGRWSVTVTAVWEVTWNGISGGVPVAGGQVIQLTAVRSFDVGELQVLVIGAQT